MMRTIMPTSAHAIVMKSNHERAMESQKEMLQGLSAAVIEAYNMLLNLDLLIPSVMTKGAEFSFSTLSMVHGIPIKPMLAKYIPSIVIRLLFRKKEYESSDSVCLADEDSNFDNSIYTTEFLNGLRMSGIPNHSIKLKIGTPIMLMRNINQRAGLCNGTRLQVLRLGINIIEAQIISGGSVCTIYAIPAWLLVRPTQRCR
uniref:DNA ligase 6 n=1 Tax=Tanacetum cinerariifolium TaxID=118510 RepID=A0A699H8N6_TANCI|nr:DNA ligase 6 [Tanacetum cinerariifolium]